MKAFQRNIYFTYQAPRIGCGFRYCDVYVGRKWVRIVERATKKRARFSMQEYRILIGEERQPLRRIKK